MTRGSSVRLRATAIQASDPSASKPSRRAMETPSAPPPASLVLTIITFWGLGIGSRIVTRCGLLMAESLASLSREVISCERCPRLVEWRERSAAEPPRRYRGERYWARPLLGFGDPRASVLIVGLAP